MSLVNEALRKARLEASRKETKGAETPVPGLGHGMHPPAKRSPISPATVLLLALGAVAVAIVLMVARGFGTPADEQVDGATPTEELAAATLAEPAAGDAPPAEASTSQEADTSNRPQSPGGSRARAVATQSVPQSTTRAQRSTDPAVSVADSATPAAPGRPPTAASAEVTDDLTRAAAAIPPDSPPQTVTESREAPSTPGPTTDRQAAAEADARAVPDTAAEVAVSEPSSAEDTDATESFLREAEIPGVGTYRLDGIAWSSERPFALVNGQVVGPGGFVDGATVARVEQDRVLLTRDNRRFEIRLR